MVPHDYFLTKLTDTPEMCDTSNYLLTPNDVSA